MAEPEVRFEQAEEQAKVTVEQQEPQINVQRAQGGSEGQPQQLAAGGQMAAADQQALQRTEQAVMQAQVAPAGRRRGRAAGAEKASSSIQQAIEQAPGADPASS